MKIITQYLFLYFSCLFSASFEDHRVTTFDNLPEQLEVDTILPMEKKDIFIVSKLSDTEVYVGQKVFLEYILYTTMLINYVIPDSFSGYQGLQIISNTESCAALKEVIGDTVYTVKTILKYTVYPMQEGTFKIPSHKFKLGVFESYGSCIDNKKQNVDTFIVSIGEPTIKVHAIPDMPVTNFAVDCYEMYMTSVYPIGLDGRYGCEITLKSNGHPTFLFPPKLNLRNTDADVTIYIESDAEKTSYAKVTTRTFYYDIKFKKTGKYNILPILQSWDSSTSEWKTITPQNSSNVYVEKVSIQGKENLITPSKNETLFPLTEVDVVWLIDISSSMLSKDFEPSRLSVLKQQMDTIIERKSEFSRISVIAFAGQIATVLPFSTDKSTLKGAVDKLEVGKLEDGALLGNGMLKALYSLKGRNALKKEIVIFSDFSGHLGYFDIEQIAKIISSFGIELKIVAIGKGEIVQTPISRRPNGSYIFENAKLSVDKYLLNNIVKNSGGRVIFVESENDFSGLKTILQSSNDNLSRQELSDFERKIEATYYENMRLLEHLTMITFKD